MKPKDKKLGLTAARLQEVLWYDSGSGLFIWRKKPHKSASSIKAGDVAGSVDNTGYIRIWIDRKRYVGHRLAWLYSFGEWPKDQVDHIDGNRKNNRILNLREATAAQNSANSNVVKVNTATGIRGVTLQDGKYRVRIQRNGKMVSLGMYNTLADALNAYNDEKSKRGEMLHSSLHWSIK